MNLDKEMPDVCQPRRWLVHVTGISVFLISLAHIPPGFIALNYFDTPKRLLWALLAFLLVMTTKTESNRLGRAYYPALGLIGWMIVRTFIRPVPSAEVEVLFTWMFPVLFFILGAGIPRCRRQSILAAWLLFAAIFQAVLMILQRIGLDPFFAETTEFMEYDPGRMIGTIGYQNQAIDFVAIAGSGIIFLSKSSLVRTAVIMCLLGVACLTSNRGGILALSVALLSLQTVAFCSASTEKKILSRFVPGTLFLLVATIGIVLLVPETKERFRELFEGPRGTPAAETRINMLRIAGDMIKEKPIIGWGAGEYALQYLDRLGHNIPTEKTHQILKSVVFAREAHNEIAQFAAEFGLIGLIFVGALFVIFLRQLRRNLFTHPSAAVGSIYILFYMTISGLFSFPWQSSMAGPLAGLLLGWLWTDNLKSENRVLLSKWEPLLAKSALLVTSLLALVWFTRNIHIVMSVPTAIKADSVHHIQRRLSTYDYRFRALLGAHMAIHGDIAQAEKELLEAERGYRDILLWNNLGNVSAEQGRWQIAAAYYERWARTGISHALALANLSVAYEQAGQPHKAAKALSQRLNLFGQISLDDIKRLAVLYIQSGNFESARGALIQYWNHTKDADPATVAQFDNLMGVIELAEGNQLQARTWFTRALDNDPSLESAKRNLRQLEAQP